MTSIEQNSQPEMHSLGMLIEPNQWSGNTFLMQGSQMKKQKRIFACDVKIQYTLNEGPILRKTLYVKCDKYVAGEVLNKAKEMLRQEVGEFQYKAATSIFYMEEE